MEPVTRILGEDVLGIVVFSVFELIINYLNGLQNVGMFIRAEKKESRTLCVVGGWRTLKNSRKTCVSGSEWIWSSSSTLSFSFSLSLSHRVRHAMR